jgi:hypothetical protein
VFVLLCSGRVIELPTVKACKVQAGLLVFFDDGRPCLRIDRREVVSCGMQSSVAVPC